MARQERYVGPAGRFLEDFTVGEKIVTQGRTVTAADGLFWAMFSGDMNPMHVDYDYAAKHGIFGGAFPPGLASIGIASGLMERLGLSAGTGLAIIEQTIRYKAPVLFGDTIRLALEVLEVQPHAVKPQGKVLFAYAILRGEDETVIEGEWRWLFASRAALDHPA